jgi:hypothetical protein
MSRQGRSPWVRSALPLAVLAAAALGGGAFWVIRNQSDAASPGRDGKGGHPTPPAALTERVEALILPVRGVVRTDEGKDVVRHGSCVAVNHKGGVVFLTAAHVISPEEGRKAVTVLVNGNERDARVEQSDSALDVAVLTVGGYEGKGIDLTDREPTTHAEAFIFGYPVKYAGTAFPRLIGSGGRLLEHDFAYEGRKDPVLRLGGGSHPGGSGGAVVDGEARLIGLVFAAQFVKGETTHVYAVPARRLTELLPR